MLGSRRVDVGQLGWIPVEMRVGPLTGSLPCLLIGQQMSRPRLKLPAWSGKSPAAASAHAPAEPVGMPAPAVAAVVEIAAAAAAAAVATAVDPCWPG